MIYVVEDDAGIRELVVYALRGSGLDADGAGSGTELTAALRREPAKLVLLDIMLPGEDGIAILRRLRAADPRLPIMMMTARGSEYDKVIGLDSGADDYIVKPFGVMELLSRVRALLRRSSGGGDTLICGPVALDAAAHKVSVNGAAVELTLKEFELLRLLMSCPGRVLTREQLLDSVWGYTFDCETRTVDVHVRTLRAKLGIGGDIIETVRGVGYRVGGGK